MVEEQTILGVLLAPLSDAPETTIEVMVSQAEAGTVDPSGDNDNIDIKEDNTTIRTTKQSHMNFGESKVKGGYIEVLNRFGYIDNIDWVRLGCDDLVPKPKGDKVVVFRSFLKAELRFPLHKTIVVVLERFNIYLHQLTPNVIVRFRIFI